MTLGALRAVDAPAPSERHAPTTLRAEALALGPALAILIVSWGIAAHLQAGAVPMLRASFALIVTQLLPGTVVWRTVRPPDGWAVEDVACGFAIGAALAVPSQVVAAWSGWTWAAPALPLAIAATLIVCPASRLRMLNARWSALPWWFGVASLPGLVAAVVSATELFGAAMNDGSGWSRQHVDMPYELALSAEAMHHFPPHYPQMSSMPLDYHWFANAWVAQIGLSSGTELDVTMFRFMPVLAGTLLPLAVAACTLRLTGRASSASVAPLLVMLGGSLPIWQAPSSWTPLWPNSVSMTFAAILLCPLLIVLTERWRGKTLPGSWALLALLALVSGGAKGSVLPVLLIGGTFAVVALATLRQPRRRAFIDTLTLGAALGLLMKTLFAGNDGALSLTFLQGLVNSTASLPPNAPYPHGIALALIIVACLLAMVVPWAASVWLVIDQATRRDPAVWLLIGLGAAGIGGISLFAAIPANQFWFRSTAQIPLSIALAWALMRQLERGARPGMTVLLSVPFGATSVLLITGVVRSHQWPSAANRLIGIGVFLALTLLVATIVRFWFPTVSRGFATLVLISAACLALPHWWVAPPASAERPVSISAGQVETARFIRAHSKPDSVVMTDRHCTRPRPIVCDPRHFWYAAYTERPMLLEGWSYTSRSTYRPGLVATAYMTRFWDPGLLRLNDTFFRAPTAQAARRLWAMGVRWAMVDRTVDPAPSLAPYARLRFSTPTAQAWRLTPPR